MTYDGQCSHMRLPHKWIIFASILSRTTSEKVHLMRLELRLTEWTRQDVRMKEGRNECTFEETKGTKTLLDWNWIEWFPQKINRISYISFSMKMVFMTSIRNFPKLRACYAESKPDLAAKTGYWRRRFNDKTRWMASTQLVGVQKKVLQSLEGSLGNFFQAPRLV